MLLILNYERSRKGQSGAGVGRCAGIKRALFWISRIGSLAVIPLRIR